MDAAAFVLVHSPLVGPSTWTGVAEVLAERGHRPVIPLLLGVESSPQPHWRWCADRVVEWIEQAGEAIVLVGHSGAGTLLPVIGHDAGPAVLAYVFVDASLPARAGPTPVVPTEFRRSLAARAENGRLPKWSRWWGEEAMRALVPDDVMRRRLEDEMPSLPLSYFQEEVPVPSGWPDAVCGYLQFSPVYDPEVREAEARGWRTRRLPGEHLHMVVEPGPVAQAILDLAATIPGRV